MGALSQRPKSHALAVYCLASIHVPPYEYTHVDSLTSSCASYLIRRVASDPHNYVYLRKEQATVGYCTGPPPPRGGVGG